MISRNGNLGGDILPTMKPKVIKSEAEYEAALAYVAELMDAAPGSPEEQDLELFALLVEQYEREHYPIALPDPVDAILFRMEQGGRNAIPDYSQDQ